MYTCVRQLVRYKCLSKSQRILVSSPQSAPVARSLAMYRGPLTGRIDVVCPIIHHWCLLQVASCLAWGTVGWSTITVVYCDCISSRATQTRRTSTVSSYMSGTASATTQTLRRNAHLNWQQTKVSPMLFNASSLSCQPIHDSHLALGKTNEIPDDIW